MFRSILAPKEAAEPDGHRVENDKRTARVEVRLGEAESSALKRNAASSGMSVGEYIRARCVYSTPEWLVVDRSLLVEGLREAARQGNNLNQIARRLNSVHGASLEKSIEVLNDAIAKCLGSIWELAEEQKRILSHPAAVDERRFNES